MNSVLVTGGTTRLGRTIADALRADGWRVLTSSHRPDAGADLVADLSEPGAADRLFAAAVVALDGAPPDALVNNAALFVGPDAVIRTVNLEAPKRLTELMAGRHGGSGAVVNVLDAKALTASLGPTQAPAGYLSAKRELLAETHAAAARYVGVLRVNAVAPGSVLAPTQVHEPAGAAPFGRPTPGQVAAAVRFLLSAAATTGCVIPVDGGQHLA